MRSATLFSALIVGLCGCVQDANSTKNGPPVNPLFGKWEAVSGEALGKKIEGKNAWGMRITFGADKAIWHFDTPEGEKSYDGYCRLDSAKQPHEIGLRQPKSDDANKTALGIYKIDGDTLWLHMGSTRPKDFDESTLTKLILERVKK